MPCRHPSKSVGATGDVYCLRCGQVLGFACAYRDCGCPADPRVFGHVCRGEGPPQRTVVVSRGITLRV